MPGEFYGVNATDALVNEPAARPAALQAMRVGGLSFVRVDASWGGIEPVAPVAGLHSYAWATYDLFVADLARHGLRWYPMLGYSAPWASSIAANPVSPPADDAAFASFAAELAKRYGSSGSFWAAHPELPKLATTVYGIWNEPNNDQFWQGAQASPARYMSLYLTARAAIKSVDPGARVTTAGVLDSGTLDGSAYLRAMLDSAPGARGQIDAVDWHPYVGDLTQILASIARARATLDRYGLGGVPIEISEVGWDGQFFAPAQRAEWVRDLAAKLPYTGLNVTRLLPFVWTGDLQWAQWSLTNLDGSLGPIGGAYFAGVADASLPHPGAAPQAASRKKGTAPRTCRTPRSRSSQKVRSSVTCRRR